MGASARPGAANAANAANVGSYVNEKGERIPFASITKDHVAAILKAATPEVATVNRKFVENDHWQDGAGWIGPTPAPDDPKAATIREMIERAFISRNVVSEIVERHMTGVVGRTPTFTLVPTRPDLDKTPITPQEEAEIAEAYAALTWWLDRRKVHGLIQAALSRLLWAGRSPVRVYVPKGLMSNVDAGAGTFAARTLVGALAKIYADAVEIESAHVYTDPDTKDDLGIYSVKQGDKVVTFLSYLAPVDPSADTEGPNAVPRPTVFRVIGGDAAGAAGAAGGAAGGGDAEAGIDLGGRITVHEMTRSLLITPQVQQAQKGVNLAATSLGRGVVTSGFLERIITNAQVNGTYERDAAGKEKFVPDRPLVFGAGVTTMLEGIRTEDRMSAESIATPGVIYRPPTPLTPIIEAKRSHYEDALEEADQAHVLINGLATASGKSREEARADFGMSLLMTGVAALPFIRWLLETALALGEAATGAAGKWTKKYRVDVALRISTGPISVEERGRNEADVKAGLLSRESAMERNDIADPQAELQRMEADAISRYGSLTALGLALKALVDAGASFEAAVQAAGVDPDLATKLLTPGTDRGVTEDDPDGGGDPADDAIPPTDADAPPEGEE